MKILFKLCYVIQGSVWAYTLKNKVFYPLQDLNTHATDGLFLAIGKVAKGYKTYCV